MSLLEGGLSEETEVKLLPVFLCPVAVCMPLCTHLSKPAKDVSVLRAAAGSWEHLHQAAL